jgi:hypothetical protein
MSGAGAETPRSFQTIIDGLLDLDTDASSQPVHESNEPADKVAPLLMVPVPVMPVAPPLLAEPLLPAAPAKPLDSLDASETASAPAPGGAAQIQFQADWIAPEPPAPQTALPRVPETDRVQSPNQELAFAVRLVPAQVVEMQAVTGAAPESLRPSAQVSAPGLVGGSAVLPAWSRTEETIRGEAPAVGRSESAPVERSADPSAGWQDSNGPRDKDPRSAQAPESLQAQRQTRREQGTPSDEEKPARADTAAAQNAGALTAPPLSRSAETTQPLDTKEAASSTRPTELRESEPDLRTAASSAAPARDISLRISVGANERVELRVTDRAGEVRVAVRMPIPTLPARSGNIFRNW